MYLLGFDTLFKPIIITYFLVCLDPYILLIFNLSC